MVDSCDQKWGLLYVMLPAGRHCNLLAWGLLHMSA